jgi:hypothetical protein
LALATAAGAAEIVTFSYTSVPTFAEPDAPTTFNENVTSSAQVASIIINGTLSETPGLGTWGLDAEINVTAPSGQLFNVQPFPTEFGAYGSLTASNLTIAVTPTVAAAGQWSFSFVDTLGDGDPGQADATWDTVSIRLDDEGAPPPPPPPPCPTGDATATFFGVSSNGAIGDGGNSVVTANFNLPGLINTFRVSGQFTAFAPSWRSESRVRLTAPSGNTYTLPVFGGPISPGLFSFDNFEFILPQPEAGTGDWTIEFWEGFNDFSISPDATWDSVCFAVSATATNPGATGLASPAAVISDGTGISTITVTVLPGAVPLSTFANASSGVTIDASGLGLGTLVLRDNGVAPDLTAGDLVYTASLAVPASTAAGDYPLNFTVVDDQSRTAAGTITFGVFDPGPGCPAGLASASVAAPTSDGPLGDPDNTIATVDFGVPGQINTLRFSGQVLAIGSSWQSEARVALTAPSGNQYIIPTFGGPTNPGRYSFENFEFLLPQVEDGTGSWTIEFWESFNDAITPDAQWETFCVAVAQTQTSPEGDGLASPAVVVNSGTESSILTVSVAPGAVPTSTFALAASGVTVDGSGIGLGTITLRDNGVAPDAAAGDLIYTAQITVPASAATGPAPLNFTILDDQGRNGSGQIAFEVLPPAPGCATGLASATFTGVESRGLLGDFGNTILTHNFSVAGDINRITFAGRVVTNGGSFRSEARIRATAPDGSVYIVPTFGLPASPGVGDITGFTLNLPTAEAGTGTWSFEFYETFNDGPVDPDAVWRSMCITADGSGACCLSTGCEVLTISECATRGGTFSGVGTNCGEPSYEITTPSASLFEDISGVGALLTPVSDCDDCVANDVPIGFLFSYLGAEYTTLNVSSNGNIQFPPSAAAIFTNAVIPTADAPNNMLAPFWDDLNAGVAGEVYTYLDETGGPGNRRFIVSWQNVTQFALTTSESFQVVLYEGSNDFEFRYGAITPEAAAGDYTIGYENLDGTAGVQIPGADIGSGNTTRRFVFDPGTNPCDSGGGCPACPADFDQDGGVTPADISAFFAQFEAGDVCGDVDQDGGVTPADVGAFFAVFEAGGC